MALTPAAYPVCRYVTLAEGTPRDDKLRKELMGALGGALGFQVLRFCLPTAACALHIVAAGFLGLRLHHMRVLIHLLCLTCRYCEEVHRCLCCA